MNSLTDEDFDTGIYFLQNIRNETVNQEGKQILFNPGRWLQFLDNHNFLAKLFVKRFAINLFHARGVLDKKLKTFL
jgi:hypothetical protein